MFVKIFLFLLCAVILNISEGSSENNTEVKSDCGDLISCVGAWIGEFLVNDNKPVPTRQIKESHVLSAMGDVLSDLSSLIVETFKNITKDKTLIKNDLNKTMIGVQTFTINDTYINSNHTSDKIKVLLLDNVEESYKKLNHTKPLDVILDNKNEDKNERDDRKVPKTLSETAYLSTTNVPISYTTINIFDVMKPKESDKSPNEETVAETLKNNTNSPVTDSNQFIVSINLNFSPNKDAEDMHVVIPLDITNSNVNMTSEIEQKDRNSSMNIPKKVASNYKITYETPINAINLEIKAKDDKYISQHENIVNDTVNNVFDILHSFNSSLLEIVTQTVHNSNKSVILNQTTEDYVNSVVGQNFTYLNITTKGESNLKESATNLTRNDGVNDLKDRNVTLKQETNIAKSATLNRTTNVDDDYITKIQFDIETLLDPAFTQPPNNGADKFEYQNPHENEISVYDNFNYNVDGENGTDYLELDYISMYKDVTVEDVEYTPPIYIPPTPAPVTSDEVYEDNGIGSIFPWIATVFVKSEGTDQFEYICDGSLVSERVVLTAARCLKKSNVTEDAGNVLIILGKRSLQATGPNEKVVRVKQIKFHENFTDVEGKVDNDLAIIVLDETVAFNDGIQKALLSNNEDDDDVDATYSVTTGWHITGTLTPIYYFNKESRETCVKNTVSINTFCARFGDGITTCPSFGGAFVTKTDAEWRLQGISTGKPTSSGVCFDKNVTFTNIRNYFRWIMDNVNINKDY